MIRVQAESNLKAFLRFFSDCFQQFPLYLRHHQTGGADMDYQNIFQRVEEKYLVNREQFAALNAALGAHMEADPRGQHTISNVYYDTDDFALVRHSLEKPLYKEKLRLRCYGKADAQTVVFPEIKKKFDGVVYKRRVAMPLKDAERFLATGLMKAPQQQIHREIADFRRRCEIFPKAFIAYDRVALFDPADEALRITFDRNIRFRLDRLTLIGPPDGELLLPGGEALMEVKIARAMPLWLSRALSELEIFPASFSKYGRGYAMFVLNRRAKGGIRCA